MTGEISFIWVRFTTYNKVFFILKLSYLHLVIAIRVIDKPIGWAFIYLFMKFHGLYINNFLFLLLIWTFKYLLYVVPYYCLLYLKLLSIGFVVLVVEVVDQYDQFSF